ncbi:MAG: cofactor assembly of complex C subunit B [Cyanobacteria bacterium]|nr:cofactor assembly of complex C subunit B [Cyanobacteriota bacterium]
MSPDAVVPSTLFLTLLMGIGLLFFIRASVKDRTEIAQFAIDRPEPALRDALRQYFADRGYQPIAVDTERDRVTLEGFVSPSLPLALFLSLLAAIGLGCLGLILVQLLPPYGFAPMAIVLMAPVAGWFYWRKAGRLEQVQIASGPASGDDQPRTLKVMAHRDEIATLRETLNLKET